MSDVPTMELVEQLRRANTGLRDVLTARDAQLAVRDAQVAELQRRLGSGSDDSGTPTSKESIEAKARRKAERQARQEQDQEQEPRGGSSRQRSKDKARGGQPGHPGHGLRRDPNPNQRLPLEAPAECRGCGDDLSGAADAGTAWSQIWDVKILPWRIEYLLPRRRCACTVTTVARPPDGGVVNSISFGPVLNTAAIALTAFGNVPTERTADLISILYGQDVSAGFVDRANTRLAAKLTEAGFDTGLIGACTREPEGGRSTWEMLSVPGHGRRPPPRDGQEIARQGSPVVLGPLCTWGRGYPEIPACAIFDSGKAVGLPSGPGYPPFQGRSAPLAGALRRPLSLAGSRWNLTDDRMI